MLQLKRVANLENINILIAYIYCRDIETLAEKKQIKRVIISNNQTEKEILCNKE